MSGLSYHQKTAMINEQSRQSRLNAEAGESSGGLGGIIGLIELFLAFVLGMTMLDNLGSDALRSLKYSTVGAGVAGIVAYFILHKIPGIRWLMMFAMILLWAFVAYSIGQMVIGDDKDGFHLVAHKGPYIAAAVAGLFRGFMYR